MLPSKLQNQVSLMKIAIKQSELIEDFNFTPFEGDKTAFNAAKQTAIEAYAETMRMLTEMSLDIIPA